MKISPSKIRARLQTRDISRALRCVWIFFLRVLKVGEFVLDFPSLFFLCVRVMLRKKIFFWSVLVLISKNRPTPKKTTDEREKM